MSQARQLSKLWKPCSQRTLIIWLGGLRCLLVRLPSSGKQAISPKGMIQKDFRFHGPELGQGCGRHEAGAMQSLGMHRAINFDHSWEELANFRHVCGTHHSISNANYC